MHVDHPRRRIALDHQIADGVHEMGLAETDAAVDEQRIVGAGRVVADLRRGGARELVRFTLDKILEGEFRLQSAHMAHFIAIVLAGEFAGLAELETGRGALHLDM